MLGSFQPFFFMSIFDRIFSNENKGGEPEEEDMIKEGVNSSFIPELELDKPDDEIIEAVNAFIKQWQPIETKLKPKQRRNELAWKNKLSQENLEEEVDDLDSSDNAIFEAHETFIPAATREHPEPVISSPNNAEQIIRFAKTTKDLLVYDLDRDKTKLKMRRVAKFWDLYYSGPLTIYFDEEENRIATRSVRPQNIIFERGAEIEGGWYKGNMLVERKEATAEKLVEMFPKFKKYIEQLVDKKMSTKIGYFEVWTKEYHCFKLREKILKKEKNPHFNYSKSIPTKYDQELDQVIREDVEPLNHFTKPRIPYFFLSVYNLGKEPVDDTTLFEQTIPYQRTILKRNEQIDENVDGMNGGWIGSPTFFDEDTLKDAVIALRSGNAVLADPNAIKKESGNALDGNVFNDLNDRRQRLKQVYGIEGLLPSGLKSEDTVRGKILAKGASGDRMSGGIIESIEQVYDAVINYWIQMIYVYYEKEDLIRIIGEDRADEYMGQYAYMVNKELSGSIKEGSLIPDDDLTKRNEAVDLAGINKIDDISFFESLDYADPKEMAYKLWLQTNNPMQYFAEFGGRQVSEQIQQQAQMMSQQGSPPVTDLATEASPSLLPNVPIQ